ncbi:hypothetical protein SAG0136_02365 [Streptococcus agalactiae LMG 14747]|uniref:Uncharacterized protein n=1 Tax=Streptococcus agalactiae LMG 14747 TaxID=1154860 RepID=V6Z031_STRAG|nr:hypothetical protein SAG0136_02365 [Streptococcus agalactiae LMG 14747]
MDITNSRRYLLIEYKDIASLTGRSVSTVKKWRLKIEELSGYEFEKTKSRVSRRSVQVYFVFSEEEVVKFVELSKEITRTNDLDNSVKKVWGDLNAQLERDLGKEIRELRIWIGKYTLETNKRIEALESANKELRQELSRLKEKQEEMEESQPTGLLSKFKNKR